MYVLVRSEAFQDMEQSWVSNIDWRLNGVQLSIQLNSDCSFGVFFTSLGPSLSWLLFEVKIELASHKAVVCGILHWASFYCATRLFDLVGAQGHSLW